MLNDKQRYYGKTKVLNLEDLKNTFTSKKFDYLSIVLLFGSRVLGTYHDRSDYDFAICYEKEESVGWGMLSKVWVDVGEAFKLDEVDYDVIDLSSLTSEMKQSIINGYIVLKGSEDDISRVFGEHKASRR